MANIPTSRQIFWHWSENPQIQVTFAGRRRCRAGLWLLSLGFIAAYPKFAPSRIVGGCLVVTGPLSRPTMAIRHRRRSREFFRSKRSAPGMAFHGSARRCRIESCGPADNFSPSGSRSGAGACPQIRGRQGRPWWSGQQYQSTGAPEPAARAAPRQMTSADAVFYPAGALRCPRSRHRGHTRVDHVADIARLIAAVVGYTGETHWDETETRRGHPASCLDRIGPASWVAVPRICSWRDGIEATVEWCLRVQCGHRQKGDCAHLANDPQ